MFMNQLSVFVENRQGRLAEITRVLQDNEVDIRAVSIADTREFGILRLIVSDSKKAALALKEEGFTVSLTKVIGVGFDDKPGSLCGAMTVLDENNINTEYMYAFVSKSNDKAYVILRVSDNEAAVNILRQAGFVMFEGDDIK